MKRFEEKFFLGDPRNGANVVIAELEYGYFWLRKLVSNIYECGYGEKLTTTGERSAFLFSKNSVDVLLKECQKLARRPQNAKFYSASLMAEYDTGGVVSTTPENPETLIYEISKIITLLTGVTRCQEMNWKQNLVIQFEDKEITQ